MEPLRALTRLISLLGQVLCGLNSTWNLYIYLIPYSFNAQLFGHPKTNHSRISLPQITRSDAMGPNKKGPEDTIKYLLLIIESAASFKANYHDVACNAGISSPYIAYASLTLNAIKAQLTEY